ncbi:hypothetical protein DUNSADRAFT_12614 [Dunaliella salina]|uniref:Encoded protein n=1 Tax=Dunaliella salina TaxID=3046 RepID=A0ABQ7GAW7_DUNSA|nr:hypothetical protein DUNSADRAFT_12614 [Dunaliella salina]|eukprot:KAF5831744.1 hypothetical protein DUNSADRAFT_12614 [Dunaliella salina]
MPWSITVALRHGHTVLSTRSVNLRFDTLHGAQAVQTGTLSKAGFASPTFWITRKPPAKPSQHQQQHSSSSSNTNSIMCRARIFVFESKLIMHFMATVHAQSQRCLRACGGYGHFALGSASHHTCALGGYGQFALGSASHCTCACCSSSIPSVSI